MKIGINASFLRKQNTGIGQVTANFLKKLAEFPISNFQFPNNKEVEFVLYLEEKTNLKLPKNFSQKVFLPRYKRDDLIRRVLWEKVMLPEMVRQDGCDVFLSMYQSATIFEGKMPHVMVAHDIIPKLLPQYLDNWRKKLYQIFVHGAIKQAGKIIAVSHRTEKDLVQHLGIDPQKIAVAYPDVDEIYKKEVSAAESAKVLKKYKLKPGYIYNGGGMDVRKNAESVLKAYKILYDKHGKAGWLPELVISGKLMPQLAPLVTDAKKLVGELGLKKNVKLLDYVPQEDLPALYRNAVVFVYPSLYEGFGLPVLEAMNQGTPVITSKVSSLPEVGSDAVLYCDPKNTEDLEMVLKNLLNNKHLQAALSLKGKERASCFAWEKFVEKTMHIINELKNGTN